MTTDADTKTKRGIAWRLVAPSSSGGKVYTIAVVGSTMITGWGRRASAGSWGAGSQVKVQEFSTHEMALNEALARTNDKQARGYGMDIEPRQYQLEHRTYMAGPMAIAERILRSGLEV